MTFRTRSVVLLAVSLTVAAVCARLGVWQVSRLHERRAHNALLLGRMRDSAVMVAGLSADTALAHYRVATASGVLAYDREFAWAPRMRHGSPGVNLMTPMRVPGVDGLVVIDRGWAYSPDAKSVQFSRWRERDTSTVTGYVETWSQPCDFTGGRMPVVCGDTAERLLRRLNQSAAEALAGERLAPFVIVQTSDSTLRADSVPARAEEPELDEGPHFGYALQWFAFATIALAGGIALAVRDAKLSP